MTRPAARLGLLWVIVLALAAGGGCESLPLVSKSSSLTAQSQSHPDRRLHGRFDHAVYSFGDSDTLTIVLVDGPIDRPRQAVTIRMFWRPRAGSTPVSATATNASIQYVVFARQRDAGGSAGAAPGASDAAATSGGDADIQLGIYSGAGFLFPTSRPGNATFRGELWQGHLQLSDATEHFADRLGAALLRGDVTAVRDDSATADLLRTLNARITELLGYPRLVRGE